MRRITQFSGPGTTRRDTDPAPSPTPPRSSNAVQSPTSPPPSARQNGRTGTHAPTSRRPAARDAELRGRAADTRPLSPDEYLKHWRAWARQGRWLYEKRTEASRGMAWVDFNKLGFLNLENMYLRSLPEHLPALLTGLNLDRNQLTHLPKILPASLTSLRAVSNQLTLLPENLPASLTYLNVDRNQLTQLPKNLPASLTYLSASKNLLTHLPENLPDSLTRLSVNTNQLKSLPEKLPASLTELNANDNQLTHLPEKLPASLVILAAISNQLTHLPKNLPASRAQFYFNRNPLTRPTENLPAPLPTLEVNDTPLTRLPENVPVTPPEAEPQPAQDELTLEQRIAALEEKVPGFFSNVEALTNQSGTAPPPEAMKRLIDSLKICFANDMEQRQWEAEILALKNKYPNSAKGALLLYNRISMALLTLHQSSPYSIAAGKNAPHSIVSNQAMFAKTLVQALTFVPLVGPAAAALCEVGINYFDQKNTGQQLLSGLADLSSLGRHDQLTQQTANMQKITHALSYRLALNYCRDEQPRAETASVTGQTRPPTARLRGLFARIQKPATPMNNSQAVGADPSQTGLLTDKEINQKVYLNLNTYTGRIRDKIMEQDGKKSFESVEQAVVILLSASLTTPKTDPISQRYPDPSGLAEELGKEHQEIMTAIRQLPKSEIVLTSESVNLSPLRPQEGAVTQAQSTQNEQTFTLMQEDLYKLLEKVSTLEHKQTASNKKIEKLEEDNRKLKAQLKPPPDTNPDGPLVQIYDTPTAQGQAGQAQLNAENETRINDIAERLVVVEEASGVGRRKESASNYSANKEKLFRPHQFF